MMGDFCWFLHREDGMYVRYEVFTLVNMNSTIFWDVTLCSPIVVHECFVGTYTSIFRLCLPPDSYWILAGFLLGIIFDPEDKCSMFL
jgi:hypothetical protein